jgi:hypothetical protein
VSEPVAWTKAAAWAALVARWLAAQFVLRRLELVQKVVLVALAVVAGLAALSIYASTRFDPDWPWLGLSTLLVLCGIASIVVVRIAVWIVRRLALSRKARPIAGVLATSKDRMLAELDGAGAPVSVLGATRFLWAAVRGRQPHRGLPDRLKAVVARSDEVLDLPSIRATLDGAARRGPRPPISR